jgi:hypothetical protein
MSIKSIENDVEKKTFLNMSIFFSYVSVVWSLNLRMSILRIFRNKWFLFFAHFASRHKFVSVSIVFSIFWRKLIFLTFWIIFYLWSFVFIYVDQSLAFCVNNQRRRNRRMFLITSSHFLIQKNLTYRFDIIQNKIFLIIDCRNFWISRTYSSISEVDDERDKNDAFFSTFLIFLNRSSFTLFEKFEMSSTQCCRIYKSKLICNSMINLNRVSSRNVLIFRLNKTS